MNVKFSFEDYLNCLKIYKSLNFSNDLIIQQFNMLNKILFRISRQKCSLNMT